MKSLHRMPLHRTLPKTLLTHSLMIAGCLLVLTPVSAQDEDAVPTAEPVAAAVPTLADPVASATSDARPLTVTVELISSEKSAATNKIVGTLTDTNTLEMRTSFGVVQVPLSEVAGFRFPSADDASTTVVMLNGDSITGATDVKLVTVETEWGVAQINGQNIQSILFVPGLNWSASKGLNGNRWSLSNVPSAANSTTTPRPSSTLRTNPNTPARLQNFQQPFGN